MLAITKLTTIVIAVISMEMKAILMMNQLKRNSILFSPLQILLLNLTYQTSKGDIHKLNIYPSPRPPPPPISPLKPCMHFNTRMASPKQWMYAFGQLPLSPSYHLSCVCTLWMALNLKILLPYLNKTHGTQRKLKKSEQNKHGHPACV